MFLFLFSNFWGELKCFCFVSILSFNVKMFLPLFRYRGHYNVDITKRYAYKYTKWYPLSIGVSMEFCQNFSLLYFRTSVRTGTKFHGIPKGEASRNSMKFWGIPCTEISNFCAILVVCTSTSTYHLHVWVRFTYRKTECRMTVHRLTQHRKTQHRMTVHRMTEWPNTEWPNTERH